MDGLTRDIRSALRGWTQRPGFTLVIIGTLALGIGANAAVFSIIDGVLLRPLGYEAPRELVTLRTELPQQGDVFPRSAGPEMLDIDERASFLLSLGGIWARPAALTDDRAEPEEIEMGFVTGALFDTLGVAPQLGRVVDADDDIPNAPRVIVLSHGLWQRRYGARRDIIGTTMEMDGQAHEIVGVMPETFGMWMPRDAGIDEHLQAWVPWGGGYDELSRRFRVLTLVGRLERGTSVVEAQAELDTIASGIASDHADDYERSGFRLHLIPLLEDVTAPVRPALVVLWVTVALVLLIACANVTNLLLVRATGMQHEIALRQALGATGGRVLRQLVTEAVLLAAAGGALGLLLARFSTNALALVAGGQLPRLDTVAIDGRVVAVAAVATIAAGTLVGILSAFHLSRSGTSVTRMGRVLDDGGRHRLRNALVVTEIALSLVLLVGAGLMFRTLQSLANAELGYRTETVTTAKLSLIDASYPYSGPEKIARFYRTLLEHVTSAPGVAFAGASTQLPLDGAASLLAPYSYDTADGPVEWDTIAADTRVVTPGFLEALSVPLVAGRWLEWNDDAQHPLVLLVDEKLASAAWPQESAIGKRLRVEVSNNGLPTPRWGEVVGVVGHVRNHPGLDGPEQIFIAHAQSPLRTMTLALAGEASLGAIDETLRSEIKALEPSQPIHAVQPMNFYQRQAVAESRFTSYGLTAFAVVAAALASLGIYGVIAFTVGRRKREFGIRLALGASPGSVKAGVLGDALRLVVPGLLLGLMGAFAFTRVLRSLLFDVSALDPAAFAIGIAGLTAVAAVAAYLPARRAARSDPCSALRQE